MIEEIKEGRELPHMCAKLSYSAEKSKKVLVICDDCGEVF